jgi:peroxiredoxin
MNKPFLSFLGAALLAGSSLSAQQSLNDHLKAIDGQMELRQQQWLDAQKKKLKYDTIGLAAYRAEWAQLKAERKKQEIVFIKKHPRDTASLRALNDVVGHLPEDISGYERLYKGLSKELRESAEGQKTAKAIDKFMAVRIGAPAPAFSAPDTSGQQVALSDFRGKYVLLDFWASWCFPCREENPMVVKAFNQFHEQRFTVLSVSLDQPGKKEAWLKAIHDDQLQWQHVSDLKYWNNEVAQLYAVRSIPQNFLIDPNGKIIAANLRGEALIQQLEKIFK